MFRCQPGCLQVTTMNQGVPKWKLSWHHGLILGLHPANERRRYFVTTSLIGWAQAKNQPSGMPSGLLWIWNFKLIEIISLDILAWMKMPSTLQYAFYLVHSHELFYFWFCLWSKFDRKLFCCNLVLGSHITTHFFAHTTAHLSCHVHNFVLVV